MERLPPVGMVMAIGAVLLAQHLSGGSVSALLDLPALVIVLGGTLGVALMQTPYEVCRDALGQLRWLVLRSHYPRRALLNRLQRWSMLSRQQGFLALEGTLNEVDEPFIRKGLLMIVDGADRDRIAAILGREIDNHQLRDERCTGMYEAMAGYSPTMGILGAVLGLIQAMGNLDDPERLGEGIAVAFVATIYGVGLANLVFLPIASRLRAVLDQKIHYYELSMEGILAIADGENSLAIERRLQSFCLGEA